MHIRQRREIRQLAEERLSAAGNPKKIALFYGGGCTALAVVSALISLLLSNGIDTTVGLGGMGLRSVLATGETVLPFAQLIITSCLGLGYHYAMLNIARGKNAEPASLVEGFRRFGPLFRATALQLLVYILIGIATMYLSWSIFVMTPLANDFLELAMPLVSSGTVLNDAALLMDDATILAAAQMLQPLLWIYLATFALLILPVYFRFRMVTFCLADDPRRGALAALFQSRYMMHCNCFSLLKLDLTLWRYYLALVFANAVCYGDVLLSLLGVSLPWSGTVSYYLFYGLALILQMLIYYFAMNRATVVYAVAYDTLREAAEEVATPKPPIPQE